MTGPLEGIRVVELCLMAAGPWTGALLAELGADVVKVEPPTGDGTRWTHPTQRGMGTNFISMNVGKRDAILDFKQEDDKQAGLALVREADVFVQNLTVGVMDRLGFGVHQLRALNPGLVYCSISGYGSDGPLAPERCTAPLMEAFSGLARLTGAKGTELEQFRFTGLIDLVTASVAVEGILAALLQREVTGEGQHVDVSMTQAALELQHTRISEYLACGRQPVPIGSRSANLAPDGAYRTLDQELFVTVRGDAEWRAFGAAIGHEDLVDEPRFATNALRLQNAAALDSALEAILAEKPAFYWKRCLARHKVPSATTADFDIIRHSWQAVENRMIATVDTEWGAVEVGGLPWHFSRSPGVVGPTPPPGRDTDAVRNPGVWLRPKVAVASGAAATPGSDTASSAQPGRGILAGRRVLELSSGISGALAALRLQDLGADVIKVERAERDWLRGIEPTDAQSGDSAAFTALSRGKRSVLLSADLSDDAEFLRRLIRSADVVIGDWFTLGIDCPAYYEAMDEAERGACATVWIELSDLGARGPFAHSPGSELVIQAMAGYPGWLGSAAAPGERLGADVAGCTTATFTVEAVLAALFWRDKGGTGQVVRLSGMNSLLSLASIHLAAQSDPDFFAGQRVGGSYFPVMTGWSTGGRPIAFSFGGSVGPEGRSGWTDFVTDIGAEWMITDSRFADDLTGRNTTGHGLLAEDYKSVYETEFQRFSDDDLVPLIRRHGGLAAAYADYHSVVNDPQVVHLGAFREVAPPEGGAAQRALAYPIRFSAAETTLRGGIRPPGADNEEIARELELDAVGEQPRRNNPPVSEVGVLS